MNKEVILEFRGVTVNARSPRMAGAANVSFTLHSGELAIVLTDNESESVPLCNLAEGITDPDKGVVIFAGERWESMNLWRMNKMRGSIGRVFDKNGWVSNLSVYENMSLSERHHTDRTETEIRDEIEGLCRIAGLSGIPDMRPDMCSISDLRKAEWVRAFVGKHRLILLERPEFGVAQESIPKLLELIYKSIERQASVLWITPDSHAWQSVNNCRVRQFRIRNGEMSETGETHDG